MEDTPVKINTAVPSIYSSTQLFEDAQRIAKMLSSSTMIPVAYQGNVQNTLVALEMSNRMGISSLMVMQNMNIIHGKPAWSSKFIIAAINSCGRFTPLRFKVGGTDDNKTCRAYAKDAKSGQVVEGPEVSYAMAKAEGWWSKKDKYNNEISKWQTMPELMLQYRAGSFFGNLYCPDITMGMRSADEVEDIEYVDVTNKESASTAAEAETLNIKIKGGPKPGDNDEII